MRAKIRQFERGHYSGSEKRGNIVDREEQAVLKEKIKESENSLSQNQYKWLNVLFDKNGKSYRGTKLWDTIQQAQAHAEKIKAQAKGLVANTVEGKKGWRFMTMDGELLDEDFAWIMQIPVIA